MAKGITQDQVSAAADELLLAGERPTIERIRTVLGTGSPNTVNRLLDIWWGTVGIRLQAQSVKLAIPDAPKEVLMLATQLWEQALNAADDNLTADKAALLIEHKQAMQALDDKEKSLNDQLNSYISAKEQADLAKNSVELQMANLKKLFDKNTSHLIEIKEQRDNYKHQFQTAQKDLNLLRAEFEVKVKNWEIDRKETESAHQAMQDRWILEVDRARQDEAKSELKFKEYEKKCELDRKSASLQINGLNSQLKLLESTSQAKQNQIEALESELKRVHEQLSLVLVSSQAPSNKSKISVNELSKKKPVVKSKSKLSREKKTEHLRLRAIEVFGNEQKALQWLDSPRNELSGKSPVSASKTKKGYDEVLDMLGRIEHGIFA